MKRFPVEEKEKELRDWSDQKLHGGALKCSHSSVIGRRLTEAVDQPATSCFQCSCCHPHGVAWCALQKRLCHTHPMEISTNCSNVYSGSNLRLTGRCRCPSSRASWCDTTLSFAELHNTSVGEGLGDPTEKGGISRTLHSSSSVRCHPEPAGRCWTWTLERVQLTPAPCLGRAEGLREPSGHTCGCWESLSPGSVILRGFPASIQ